MFSSGRVALAFPPRRIGHARPGEKRAAHAPGRHGEHGADSAPSSARQLNFSSASCHTDSANRWLRGQRLRALDDITGHWPKHFIAEHELGLISLQQRIRHCRIVTRTQPLANGTPLWSPTISRLRGQ